MEGPELSLQSERSHLWWKHSFCYRRVSASTNLWNVKPFCELCQFLFEPIHAGFMQVFSVKLWKCLHKAEICSTVLYLACMWNLTNMFHSFICIMWRLACIDSWPTSGIWLTVYVSTYSVLWEPMGDGKRVISLADNHALLWDLQESSTQAVVRHTNTHCKPKHICAHSHRITQLLTHYLITTISSWCNQTRTFLCYSRMRTIYSVCLSPTHTDTHKADLHFDRATCIKYVSGN